MRMCRRVVTVLALSLPLAAWAEVPVVDDNAGSYPPAGYGTSGAYAGGGVSTPVSAQGELFNQLGINVNNGMVDLYEKIKSLPESKRDEIIRDLHACQEHRPKLAMVDSAKGITNFHSPNDVIVDASMPAMIRQGGKMWGADGKQYDVKFVVK